MRMRHCTLLSFPSVAIALFISPIQADVVVVPAALGSLGAYSYSYEIENQTAAGIFLFSLTVTGDVETIASPIGWVSGIGIPEPGKILVEWVSTDTPYDVPAFRTLAGFGFTSHSDPGAIAFSTFDENFAEIDGQSIGPVALTVPEPTTLSYLGAALIVAFGYFRRLANKREQHEFSIEQP